MASLRLDFNVLWLGMWAMSDTLRNTCRDTYAYLARSAECVIEELLSRPLLVILASIVDVVCSVPDEGLHESPILVGIHN